MDERPGNMAKAVKEKDPLDFTAGDFVVYPTHGVGKVTGIEEKEIAGHALTLFVISFEKERMALRVPKPMQPTTGAVSWRPSVAFSSRIISRLRSRLFFSIVGIIIEKNAVRKSAMVTIVGKTNLARNESTLVDLT